MDTTFSIENVGVLLEKAGEHPILTLGIVLIIACPYYLFYNFYKKYKALQATKTPITKSETEQEHLPKKQVIEGSAHKNNDGSAKNSEDYLKDFLKWEDTNLLDTTKE